MTTFRERVADLRRLKISVLTYKSVGEQAFGVFADMAEAVDELKQRVADLEKALLSNSISF